MRLLTKPRFDITDIDHKIRSFDEIESGGKVVACLDNEPLCINSMADRWPNARSVFVSTDHSDRGIGVYTTIPRISGFLKTDYPILPL